MRWRHILKVLVVSCMLSQSDARAAEPDVWTTQDQLVDAKKLFLDDQQVIVAMRQMQHTGYSLLQIEVAPYRAGFSDEGPHSRSLVMAWFGKREQYGWESKFLAAIVSTDHWGHRGAKLIDAGTLADHLDGLWQGSGSSR